MKSKALLGTLVVAAVLLVVVGVEAFRFERAMRKTQMEIEQLAASVLILNEQLNPPLRISVGTIQFLKRGYSVHLERAEYTQNGLVLAGQIGNPTTLSLHTLTLNFSVKRPFRLDRDQQVSDYLEKKRVPNPAPIGKAQVAVGELSAGRTAEFSVTIPNVKQTETEWDLFVSFSGQRYLYGLR